MLSSNKEQQLISQALAGNQQSFQRLYDAHADALFAFLNQFSENREEVKDWTQRAFIKAFKKLDLFKENSTFKTWLFTIGLNEMRTDMRGKIHFDQIDEIALAENYPTENEKPEIWPQAKKAIQKLDPVKRMIFLLHIAEEYSHKEIGKMLNISEVASRVNLHRAKKELNQLLMS